MMAINTIRKTKKYVSAFDKAGEVFGFKLYPSAEAVYQRLEAEGYMWDSKQGEWIELANEPSDEPTELIMIRVWSDAEIVEEVADEVVKGLKKHFKNIDRSKVYLCRPPKQLEGRVYLQFMKKETS